MDFGSIMGNLATQAGYAQIAGTQQQQREANVEDTRAQASMRQMQVLAMKQEQTDRENLAADAKAGFDSVAGGIKTQADIAKGATAAATLAGQKGHYGAMIEMEKLAGHADEQARKQTSDHILEQQQQRETMSTAASDYMAAPSTEAAQNLLDKAAKAGVDVSKAPSVSDPKFVSWAKEQEKAGMTSKERAAFVEKQREFDIKAKEIEQKNRDLAQSRREHEANLALLREGQQQFRQMQLQMQQERLELQRTEAQRKAEGKGKGMGVQAEGRLDTQAKMMSEGARSLRSMGQFKIDATASPFMDLKGHELTGAITRLGSNVITPADVQMFSVAGAGVGRAVLVTETLGAGSRAPSEAQIEGMQKTVTPQAGDTKATALYKMATGAAILAAAARVRRTHPDAKVEAAMKEDEAFFASFPNPDAILAASKDPKTRQQIESWKGTSGAQLEKYKKANGVGTGSDNNGLPPGFKED
jgi:hypothetical protein